MWLTVPFTIIITVIVILLKSNATGRRLRSIRPVSHRSYALPIDSGPAKHSIALFLPSAIRAHLFRSTKEVF
jgi:hypothetical protein